MSDERRIEYVRLDSLTADPSNPKDHDIEVVGDSMGRFGLVDMITLDDRTGYIISGHGRAKTLRQAYRNGESAPEGVRLDEDGHWLAPVVRGWRSQDDYESHAALIAMNRTTELGGWVDESLTALLDELREIPEGMKGTGFEAGEDPEEPEEPNPSDPEEVPDLPAYPPLTKEGDLWHLGEHRLVVGDSTDVAVIARACDGELADLLLTDPPYGVSHDAKKYTASAVNKGNKSRHGNNTLLNDDFDEVDLTPFLTAALTAAKESLAKGGPFYIFYAPTQATAFLPAAQAAGLAIKQQLTWVKRMLALSRQDYHWQHEPILYGWRPGAPHRWYGGYTPTTVIDDQPDLEKISKADALDLLKAIYGQTDTVRAGLDRDGRTYHPTAKPVHLLTRLIENSSREGDLVLDPFGGSGATLIAAHLNGRRAATVELDPRYADVICRRYQTVTGETPRREDGVETDFVGHHEQWVAEREKIIERHKQGG